MTRILRWLFTNEIYWALGVAVIGERWAKSARHRLRKLSGELPANIGRRR